MNSRYRHHSSLLLCRTFLSPHSSSEKCINIPLSGLKKIASVAVYSSIYDSLLSFNTACKSFGDLGVKFPTFHYPYLKSFKNCIYESMLAYKNGVVNSTDHVGMFLPRVNICTLNTLEDVSRKESETLGISPLMTRFSPKGSIPYVNSRGFNLSYLISCSILPQ